MMKMTEEEVKDLLVKTNAIMNGHFLLTSGLHSPHYVEKFNVLQHPKYTQQSARRWPRSSRTLTSRPSSAR